MSAMRNIRRLSVIFATCEMSLGVAPLISGISMRDFTGDGDGGGSCNEDHGAHGRVWGGGVSIAIKQSINAFIATKPYLKAVSQLRSNDRGFIKITKTSKFAQQPFGLIKGHCWSGLWQSKACQPPCVSHGRLKWPPRTMQNMLDALCCLAKLNHTVHATCYIWMQL